MSMAITISRGCLMAGFEVMRLSTASLWIKEKCNLVIGHKPNRLVTGISQQICWEICVRCGSRPDSNTVTSAQVLSLTRGRSDVERVDPNRKDNFPRMKL